MSGETGQKWDGNAHSSALLNVASNEGPALLRKQVLVRLVLGWQLVSKLNYRAVGRSENPGGLRGNYKWGGHNLSPWLK